jgi:hypothetical protein
MGQTDSRRSSPARQCVREFFFEGLNKFEQRLAKFIDVEGDYIESKTISWVL